MATATATYRYGRLRVQFFNVEVPTIVVGRAVYFPVRSLCKAIGMSSQMQLKRIRADSRMRDAFRTLPMPTIKGIRDTICMDKRHVAIWLGSIDPAHVPLGARGGVAKFQAELFAAADRFLFGDTSDVVYDAATKTATATGGTLRVGTCPGCGMALVLDIGEAGAHLRADDGDGDGE